MRQRDTLPYDAIDYRRKRGGATGLRAPEERKDRLYGEPRCLSGSAVENSGVFREPFILGIYAPESPEVGTGYRPTRPFASTLRAAPETPSGAAVLLCPRLPVGVE